MTDTNTASPEQELLSWKAPIHQAHKRQKGWYIGMGIVVFLIAAISLLSGAWSVAIVAILCGAMYYFVHDHAYPEVTMKITNRGTYVAGNFLSWEEISGYWLMHTPSYTELHITPKETKKRELIIQTANTDQYVIRQILNQRISELTDKRERLLDVFIRICKL
jgi:hypothetical protein